MVQRYVVDKTEPSMRRMWYATVTLQSDVHITYHYQRELSEFETTSRKLDALLYALSSEMGIWEEERYEDLQQSDGDC